MGIWALLGKMLHYDANLWMLVTWILSSADTLVTRREPLKASDVYSDDDDDEEEDKKNDASSSSSSSSYGGSDDDRDE